MGRSEDGDNVEAQTGRSGSVAAWGNQKFHDLKRKNQFLLRAKYLLLTYSQVDNDVFQPMEIKGLIDSMGGRCRIGRELHKDGGTHYHAFCVKEKRFVSRDPRRFDVDGHHPNIEPILRTPDRAWAYAVKDGDVVVDDVPERPIGRAKSAKSSKHNEVWETSLEQSKSADDMLNYIVKGDPKRAICSFNNVYSACRHFFPRNEYSEYTAPPGLAYEFGPYPEIANWKQRYLGEHTTSEVDTHGVQESSTSETDSVYSGQDRSVGTASTAGSSIDALFGEDCELARYEPLPTPAAEPKEAHLNVNQPRPKCLVVVGPSRLGKTVVARSFGPHSYFHGNWSVEQYNPDGKYNIFDDIHGQLDGFSFKSFMGGQYDITVTDKYHKKKTIKNGKPCIYLSNFDPLTTRRGREHRDWLVANCIFVRITQPICNVARQALASDAIEDALMCM